MAETILQHWIFTRFALPFLLVFFLLFAILEKSKIFGEGKKQINALVAFIIGLIVIGVTYPIDVINNLILFLTVAIVVVFVGLLLWGFMVGEGKLESKGIKITAGIVIVIAVIGAIFWATDLFDPFVDVLFKQDWSYNFWINVLFIVVVALALAFVLLGKGGAAKSS
jgi:hypothetical protein